MSAQSPASETLPALPAKPLRIALWIVQALLFAFYVFAGFSKVATPIPDLSANMPWTAATPVWFVRVMGLVDLAGGLGVLLPALTGILPRLTPAAALGCSALQVCAMLFHASRGEFFVLPVNIVLLGLSLFVLWGRRKMGKA